MPFSAARSATVPASSRLRSAFSPWKRGWVRRQSSASSSSAELKRPGEEAAAERGVGDEADAELAQRRQHLVLDVAAEQRVLALDRGDGVDGVRAPDRVGRRLAEPDVADLALLHQLGQRADGLLDRRVRVHAVLVVEVDVVGAQPLERALERLPDVLRRAVEAAPGGAVGLRLDAELGGDDDLVAAAGERAAEQLLVVVRAVQLGGVEEGDAELDRPVQRGDRLVGVGLAVEGGHAHAAEAEGGDGESAGSQLSLLHAIHGRP